MTNYQKMCAAAKEIQEAWKPKVRDRYMGKTSSSVRVIGNERISSDFKEYYASLPYIEDLMAMLTVEAIKPYCTHDISPGHNVIRAIYNWSTGGDGNFWTICEHMTPAELYLCFVMLVIHNKTWDGEQWK